MLTSLSKRKVSTGKKDRAGTYVLTLNFISITNVYVRLKYNGAHQRFLHPRRPDEVECLPRSTYMRCTVEVLFDFAGRPSSGRISVLRPLAALITSCTPGADDAAKAFTSSGERRRTTFAFSSSTRQPEQTPLPCGGLHYHWRCVNLGSFRF